VVDVSPDQIIKADNYLPKGGGNPAAADRGQDRTLFKSADDVTKRRPVVITDLIAKCGWVVSISVLLEGRRYQQDLMSFLGQNVSKRCPPKGTNMLHFGMTSVNDCYPHRSGKDRNLC